MPDAQNIPPSIAELAVPIDELRPYRKNPRRGDVDAIARSLAANGQYRPVVVRRGTNEVLAGNHTLAAAKALGWTELAATYVDVDDEQAARIVLADNRLADLATYDDVALAELLAPFAESSLDSIGYTAADVRVLLGDVDELARPGPIDAGAVRLDEWGKRTSLAWEFTVPFYVEAEAIEFVQLVDELVERDGHRSTPAAILAALRLAVES